MEPDAFGRRRAVSERRDVVQILMVEVGDGAPQRSLDDAEIHSHAHPSELVLLDAHGQTHAPIVAMHALAQLDAGEGMRCRERGFGGKEVMGH